MLYRDSVCVMKTIFINNKLRQGLAEKSCVRYVDSVCAIENEYQYQINLEGGRAVLCYEKPISN